MVSRVRNTCKKASGGVGLIGRRSSGIYSLEKSSQKFEILWVRFARNADIYFIGVVYIPPPGSYRGCEGCSCRAFLVSSMNSVGMAILNGIDSGSQCTFKNTRNGSSLLDLIVISDNIIAPNFGNIVEF